MNPWRAGHTTAADSDRRVSGMGGADVDTILTLIAGFCILVALMVAVGAAMLIAVGLLLGICQWLSERF